MSADRSPRTRPSSRRRRRAPALVALLASTSLAAGMMSTMTSARATPPEAARAADGSTAGAPAARTAAGARRIGYHQWTTTRQLTRGSLRGVRVRRGQLQLSGPSRRGRTRTEGGTTYQLGTWTSPWHSPGFALTELIPSWSARTPRRSLVEIHVRGRDARGRVSSWDLMARWAAGDGHIRRTTRSGQSDDLATVNVDTWQTRSPDGVRAYQVHVTLLRARGQRRSPRVNAVGAVASRLPGAPSTSRPGRVRGRVLAVPRYSQMIHRGHYPRWGSGGEAWCSPTSTSMVLAYYTSLPPRRARSWVPRRHVDPWVDHAARHTYDHGYRGTGNWAFNTAYAASRLGRGGGAFVTRLHNARQAERFIAAGIPLVASISFGRGELAGAPISASNGHLLVIVGFDAEGDVVVNDPAASGRAGVRRTYDRAQFERAWLRRSGGLVYVIRDRSHRLPGGATRQW